MTEKLSAADIKKRVAELDQAVRAKLREGEQLISLRNEDGNCVECSSPGEHENGCVLKKVEHDVELARTEWFEIIGKIPGAQADHDRAVDAERKYDKNPNKIVPENILKASERTLATLWAWLDRKAVLENTIKKLLSPAELDRRKEVNNRLKEVRRVASNNSKKETARDQGVPGTYLGPNGNFKPGLDARYKSDLITSALGEKIGPQGLHQFTVESALERLEQRGWLSHLEKAKASREAKAAKKSEKAAEKAKATPRTRSGKSSKRKAA